MARTLNLGILAHVDAGKTSLTERLLYAAGAIDEIGSVDQGNTTTDYLALERRRGITIRSAVTSFVIDDVTVNLIDTPGHPDFIAEVERVLGVLDGAVLVISAVEGVQPQTRLLLRTLRRLGIPTLLFVNKIDRAGAGDERVLRDIAAKLTPAVIAMQQIERPGTAGASVAAHATDDPAFASRLLDLVTTHDDALLAAYVDDETRVGADVLSAALAAQTRDVRVHPVFFGSARTGAGVEALIEGILALLPGAEGDAAAPLSGLVFKVERDAARRRLAYVRIFSGAVNLRDRVSTGSGRRDLVTAISVFADGSAAPATSVGAGRIATLGGLDDVRVGDVIGTRRRPEPEHAFALPTLETIVEPCRRRDRGALQAALTELAEQDPLIDLRQDDVRRELSISLYGEVQKEVIQSVLADDYGIEVTFRETQTICIERPVGVGAAAEIIGTDDNPFLATVGLRVESAPPGTGLDYRIAVELGSMPAAFFRAVEETVRVALREGLHGWQVADCVVTMTHSGYWARQSHAGADFDKSMSSTAGDFRNLTPLVLMDALRQAGTQVLEPMHRFRLEIPETALAAVLRTLGGLRAVPRAPWPDGSSLVLEGIIPAARVHDLQQRLATLTHGEGVLESAFDHHEPVRGVTPTRPRTDHNPVDRKEYLLHVVRRV